MWGMHSLHVQGTTERAGKGVSSILQHGDDVGTMHIVAQEVVPLDEGSHIVSVISRLIGATPDRQAKR